MAVALAVKLVQENVSTVRIFGAARSFLSRRDEAAWQAPCYEEQRRQGRSGPLKWAPNLRSLVLTAGRQLVSALRCRQSRVLRTNW